MPIYAVSERSFDLSHPSSNTYHVGKKLGTSVRSDERYPTFTIVDRDTFGRLKEAGLSHDQLVKLSSYSKLPNVSDLTQAYLLELNNMFYRWFHGYEVFSTGEKSVSSLSPSELIYVKQLVKKALADQTVLGVGKTSYEIQLADDHQALVIVENGFLHHLTQSKDDCQAFVLALLRCFDHFGTTSVGLNAFYLKLLTIPSFFQVVKTRALL